MAASTTSRSKAEPLTAATEITREDVETRLVAAERELSSICPFDSELRVSRICQRAHAVARELCAVSRAKEWRAESVRSLLVMAAALMGSAPDRAARLARLAWNEATEAGLEWHGYESDRVLATAMHVLADVDACEQMAHRAFEGFHTLGDRDRELRCRWLFYNVEHSHGRVDGQLVELSAMLAQPEVKACEALHYFAHCCIARLLTKVRPDDPAIAYHLDEAARLTSASDNPLARICYYQALVEQHLKHDQLDEALSTAQSCLALARRHHAAEGEAFALTLLAWCYEELGDEAAHRQCLDESLRLGRLVDNKGAVAVALLNRAVRSLGAEHAEVRNDLEEALSIARDGANTELEMEASRWLAEKLEASGNVHEAVLHLHRYIELQEKMRAGALDHALRAIDLERRVASTERAIQELHQRSQHLQDELEMQASEAANKSAALADQADVIRNVHTIFRQVLADTSAPREIIAELRRRFDRISLPELQWRQVSDEFVRIFPEFLTNLRRRCPSITKSEERVCCLVRLGLSTHEIASLLNITERGVETCRLRIRRKTQLTSRTSLQEYLSSI